MSSSSAASSRKLSPVLRALQEIIDANPHLQSQVEEVKSILALEKARNSRILEDLENTILNLEFDVSRHASMTRKYEKEITDGEEEISSLRGKLFIAEAETQKKVEVLASELNMKEKLSTDLKITISELLDEKRDSATMELQLGEIKKELYEEIDGLLREKKIWEVDEEAYKDELEIQKEQLTEQKGKNKELLQENYMMKRREIILKDVFGSMQGGNNLGLNHVAELSSKVETSLREPLVASTAAIKVKSNKRKPVDISSSGRGSGSDQDEKDAPKIKKEYEAKKTKTRQWAPDGYYHVKEHFRTMPRRVKKSAAVEEKGTLQKSIDILHVD